MSTNHKINMLPANVRIKLEPGTSKLNMLQNNIPIKMEQNTSERLASLKIPRDLKLTASNKTKIFKPNLNVTRNKKNDVPVPTLPQNSRGRGRGRGRGNDRGRGRGGRGTNYVQSQGVFSEGVAESLRKNIHVSDRSFNSRDSDIHKMMDKPTINKNQEWKIDKEHEESIMRELLDDHIDPEHEIINDMFPIQLPISKGGRFSNNIKDEVVKKPPKQIKQEVPDILGDETPKPESLIKTENIPYENGIEEKSMFDIKERLILFQFPDALPGIGQVKEPPHPKDVASTSNATEKVTTEDTKVEPDNRCTVRDINEGMLGKIVIYKSGKTRLVIGNNRFNIETGPDGGFLQDVMSVPVNMATRTGDMINLGSIEGTVIISPEWDDLIMK